MSTIQSIIIFAKKLAKEKGSIIVTTAGVVSFVGATFAGIKATPKAMKSFEELKAEYGDNATAFQKLKTVGKHYIPAAILTASGILCIVEGKKIDLRKNAALMSAYEISEKVIKNYHDKTKETVSPRKESDIFYKAEAEAIAENPPDIKKKYEKGKGGNVLCFDRLFGRYFYSDRDTIIDAYQSLNRDMLTGIEPYVSLNDLYDKIGIGPIDIGNMLGWNVAYGLIDLHVGSHDIAGTDEHMLVISHELPPKYAFDDV